MVADATARLLIRRLSGLTLDTGHSAHDLSEVCRPACTDPFICAFTTRESNDWQTGHV